VEIWQGVQQGTKSGLAASGDKPEDAPGPPAPRARRRKAR